MDLFLEIAVKACGKLIIAFAYTVLATTMNLDDFSKEKLWQMLVDTVHASVMYPTHKAYTRDFILRAKPEIGWEDLALRLNMSKGEALVILEELRSDNKIVS